MNFSFTLESVVDCVEAGFDLVLCGQETAIGAVQVIDIIALHALIGIHQTPDAHSSQRSAFLCVGLHEDVAEQL